MTQLHSLKSYTLYQKKPLGEVNKKLYIVLKESKQLREVKRWTKDVKNITIAYHNIDYKEQ